jgi:hypothetical protein
VSAGARSQPGGAGQLFPAAWIGDDRIDLTSGERAGGAPSLLAEHGDRSVAVGQPAKPTGHDHGHALVEVVELVLGATVARIATAIGEPFDQHRRVAETEDHPGVVDVINPAAGDAEWERPGCERHDPVGARDLGSGLLSPRDRDVAFDDRESGIDERDQPGVGAGADDPPLSRIQQARVLLVPRRSIGMRIRPRSKPATGDRKGGIDGRPELSLTDHFPIVANRGPASAGEIPRADAGDELSFDDPSVARPDGIEGKEELVAESTNDAMRRFSILVGEWTTESTHPALPDTVVHGRATFEWLVGERFLIWREHADHPEFPDAIVIIGDTDGLHAHSFDSRGSYRVVETRISDETWEYLMPREQPSDTAFAEGSSGFSGRFVGTFEDRDNTIAGRVQLSYDDENWEDDLQTTYRRVSVPQD